MTSRGTTVADPRNRVRLDWRNLVFVAAAHVAAAAAVGYVAAVHFSWWTLGLGLLWWLLCGLSVTAGYQIIQVQLASEVFVYGEGGSTGLGLMYAMLGLGTGAGPLVARLLTGDRPAALRRAIGWRMRRR